MIDRSEIQAQSLVLGVHHANVERDYVFGWLLKTISEDLYLSSLLVFKGGNCMRKVFYPNTRFSSDLDFSVSTEIDQDRFRKSLESVCIETQRQCGVQFEPEKNSFSPGKQLDQQRKSYKGRVYFRDFFGKQNEISISIRLDVTEFDRLYLPTVQRSIIHPYSDIASYTASITCMSIEELMANKLKCLIQRRLTSDLYDLVHSCFFDRSIELDRTAVLQTFLRKTIFFGSPGAAKEILLGLPMAFFGTAWNKYIVCPLTTTYSFDAVSAGFLKTIENIFGGLTLRPSRADVFFPSNLRNLIMEAGAEQKLMRMRYKGITRIVEPYSLSYKRPQNGEAKEYFYIWDTTTENGRQPSIKSFLHPDIQSLEIIDQKFSPRYEIELSKSGETPARTYFGSRFGIRRLSVRSSIGTQRINRRRTWSTSVARFTVECPYCQKRFKRTKYSTKLNRHKDPNGYNCSGRSGYMV